MVAFQTTAKKRRQSMLHIGLTSCLLVVVILVGRGVISASAVVGASSTVWSALTETTQPLTTQTDNKDIISLWTSITDLSTESPSPVDSASMSQEDSPANVDQDNEQPTTSSSTGEAATSSSVDKSSATKSSSKKERHPGTQCAQQLTQELVERVARHRQKGKRSIVMLAVATINQIDFLINWDTIIQEAGIDYAIVAAADEATAEVLSSRGIPCFRHDVDGVKSHDDDADTSNREWGQGGWKRMTWQQVFIVKQMLEWHFDVVASDLDVAWLRDPEPLFDASPAADFLFSHDGVWSRNQHPQDQLLELDGGAYYHLNTGVYFVRPTADSKKFMASWAALGAPGRSFQGHDQDGLYKIIQVDVTGQAHPDDVAVTRAAGGTIWLGVLPAYIAAGGHSYYVSKLHELMGTGDPYAVHMTWTYGGAPGKLWRMKQAMLWNDPPEYYKTGKFVTVNLQVPELPEGYNDWQENEPQIKFHLAALEAQFEQAAIGMAFAVATGRTFIMPHFVCFCEKIWHAVLRCRMPDAQDMKFPTPCPLDYYFLMDKFSDKPGAHGTPIDVRETGFLENPRTSEEIKNSQLVLKPSSLKSPDGCSAGSNADGCVTRLPGGGSQTILGVAAGLSLDTVAKNMENFEDVRVWRIDFTKIEQPWDAFKGFKCASDAKKFNHRMGLLLQEWCCRFPEDAKKHRTTETVQLSMTEANSGSGSERAPKDPSAYATIEDLRRELEQGKNQPPFTLTRTINWLSEAANNGGGGLAFAAYRWVLGLDQPPGWKRPGDLDGVSLARIESTTDPELLQTLEALLLLPPRATLKLILRCPSLASMPPGELMQRLVALKGMFPACNVARMVELVPSAFLAGPLDATLERLETTSTLLRDGLQGADVDAMFEADPTILFEEPESLEVGLQRMHELWDVDATALGNSDPEELALAVRALGLNGPPKGFP